MGHCDTALAPGTQITNVFLSHLLVVPCPQVLGAKPKVNVVEFNIGMRKFQLRVIHHNGYCWLAWPGWMAWAGWQAAWLSGWPTDWLCWLAAGWQAGRQVAFCVGGRFKRLLV